MRSPGWTVAPDKGLPGWLVQIMVNKPVDGWQFNVAPYPSRRLAVSVTLWVCGPCPSQGESLGLLGTIP